MRDLALPSFCSITACAVLFASRVFAATPEQHVRFDDPNAFDTRGRTLAIENGAVYLDATEGEGVAWLKGVQFVNGRVSIEVQGADRMGKSFVGFAFHASPDRKRSDVVYEQQREIGDLRAQLADLANRMENMRAEPLQYRAELERPPHYEYAIDPRAAGGRARALHSIAAARR